jgi:integrase
MARPRTGRTFKGIEKRGSSFTYRLRVPDPEKPEEMKQVRFGGFASAEEADRDRMQKKLDIDKRIFVLPTGETIAEFFPECIENHFAFNGKKQQSKDDYFSHLSAYIIPRIGKVALKDCNSLQLERFLLELKKSGSKKGLPLSGSTIEKVGIVLKIGFKKAHRHKLIASNPMLEVQIPKGHEKKIEHIPDEELSKLRSVWLEKPLSAFFELALNTGARKGELLCLRWSDFDSKTNTISISKTTYYSKGIHYENSPKSENSVRKVEITSSQAQSLKAHSVRQAQQRLLMGMNWKDGDYIFTNEIGESLKPAGVHHIWKKISREAGVELHHLHAVRHTHITALLQAGVQAYVVAKRAGDTVGTILKTYAHAIREDDSKCAEVFEGKMVAL